jgi:hypothetical protein
MSINLYSDSNIIDKYPNNTWITPSRWISKLKQVNPSTKIDNINIGKAFIYDDTFQYTKEVQESCDSIQNLKKIYCKDNLEESHSCTNKNSLDELKTNHDLFMKCRNIRVLENNSDCIINGKKLFKHHDSHSKQVNILSNSAYKCLDKYRKKTEKKFNAHLYKLKKLKRSYERKSHKKQKTI